MHGVLRTSVAVLLAGMPLLARAPAACAAGGESCQAATPIATLPFMDADDTTGHANDKDAVAAFCSTYVQNSGPDLVYQLELGVGNQLTITVDPGPGNYDPSVYLYRGCGTGEQCETGIDDVAGGATETLLVDGVTPGTYFLYVDAFYASGEPGSEGSYTLTVTGELGSTTTSTTTSTSTSTTSTAAPTSTTISSTSSTSTSSAPASTSTSSIVPSTTSTSTVPLPTTTSSSTTLVSTTSTSSTSTSTTTTTLPTAASICPAGGTLDPLVVKVGKLRTAAGDETWALAGTLALPPAAATAPFAPAESGLQLLVEDLGAPGAPVVDLTATTGPIPAGVPGTGCDPKDGWTKLAYRNRSNAIDPPTCTPKSANGLQSIRLKDRRARNKGIALRIKGKGATLPVPTGPLRVTLVLGATPTAGASGACATHTYTSTECTKRRNTHRCS
jgi:hypothetical protein